MNYIFDGTYYGLLTCVFEKFAQKDKQVFIYPASVDFVDLFHGKRVIETDVEKANRILVGLKRHCDQNTITNFFRAYLSEEISGYQVVFNLMVRGFTTSFDLLNNYGDSDVVALSSILKKVGREQHRMKAFVRFQKSNDELYFSIIEPDFNVLPLIAHFFKQRYSDQRWLIYDIKRKYGLLYNLKSVAEVSLSTQNNNDIISPQDSIVLADDELKFQRLWKQYFRSTNIEARKNTRLHIQHVPKRYWKYLVEKQ